MLHGGVEVYTTSLAKDYDGPELSAGALSIKAFEGSRWGGGAGALLLWVLNIGEGVEGGVAGFGLFRGIR
jgi:hypothetical protein